MCKDGFFQSDGITVHELADLIDQDGRKVFFAHPKLASDDFGDHPELSGKQLVGLSADNRLLLFLLLHFDYIDPLSRLRSAFFCGCIDKLKRAGFGLYFYNAGKLSDSYNQILWKIEWEA